MISGIEAVAGNLFVVLLLVLVGKRYYNCPDFATASKRVIKDVVIVGIALFAYTTFKDYAQNLVHNMTIGLFIALGETPFADSAASFAIATLVFFVGAVSWTIICLIGFKKPGKWLTAFLATIGATASFLYIFRPGWAEFGMVHYAYGFGIITMAFLIVAFIANWNLRHQENWAVPIGFILLTLAIPYAWWLFTGISLAQRYHDNPKACLAYVLFAFSALVMNTIFFRRKELFKRWTYRMESLGFFCIMISGAVYLAMLVLGYINPGEEKMKVLRSEVGFKYLNTRMEEIYNGDEGGLSGKQIEDIMSKPGQSSAELRKAMIALDKKLATASPEVASVSINGVPWNEESVNNALNKLWPSSASKGGGQSSGWQKVCLKEFTGIGNKGGSDPKFNDGGINVLLHYVDINIGYRYTVLNENCEVWRGGKWEPINVGDYKQVNTLQPNEYTNFRGIEGKKYVIQVEKLS